ncbi:GL14952 [Drosophila persimilis]|uniref:GL14952 n=1 Tax=Drosophila persimilis TaxID=7234 RepID=B4H087_DROPE|nr:GL14952 [Drosophila persimilis]
MPPHKWTDETRDASCYYGDGDDAANRRHHSSSSLDDDDDDDDADDEQEAFCAGDRPLIRGGSSVEGSDGCGLKTRHIIGLMGFLGFAVVYAMRGKPVGGHCGHGQPNGHSAQQRVRSGR